MHPLFDEFAYKCLIGKEERTLYTFATSGNGCTFILEMILFFSISYVAARLSGYTDKEIIQAMKAGKPLIVVYGDDIICHHSISKVLLQLLNTLGFTPNPKKSFTTKDFLYRESCGGEYIHGHDVTPIYWPRNFTNPDTILPDEYGANGKTGSFVAIVNRFAYEEDPEWTGENNSHQFLLGKLKEYHPTLQLGGAIIGPVEKSSVKCKTMNYTPDWDKLLDDDLDKVTIRYDCRIECRLNKPVREVLFPMQIKRDCIIPYLEKYTHGVENDRWIEACRVGYEAHELDVVATSQRYQGKVPLKRVHDKMAAIDRLRSLILARKVVVLPSGALNVPNNWKSMINGNAPFTDASLLVAYKLATENRTLHECAIAAIAVENGKLELFGAARGDYGVRIDFMNYRCTIKGDNRHSIRYERTEIMTVRVGHESVNKSTCLCHSLSSDLRRALWNEFRYERFLEEGPIYSDDVMCHEPGYIPYSFDRLLSVTKKDRTFEDVYSGSASSLVEKYS
jgi:hypothetical protein